MKKIEAFIKPHRLDDVTLALHRLQGLSGMTVLEARGFGRGRGRKSGDEPPELGWSFAPNIRIELFCNDEQADAAVAAIEKAAHTGLRGDGKVFVLAVEQAVRISTGERGEGAV